MSSTNQPPIPQSWGRKGVLVVRKLLTTRAVSYTIKNRLPEERLSEKI